MWNTETSAIVKVLKGDAVGAVNCLSAHPYLPLMATSGLDHTGKIWAPVDSEMPQLKAAAPISVSAQAYESDDVGLGFAPGNSQEQQEACERVVRANQTGRAGGGGDADDTYDTVRMLMHLNAQGQLGDLGTLVALFMSC